MYIDTNPEPEAMNGHDPNEQPEQGEQTDSMEPVDTPASVLVDVLKQEERRIGTAVPKTELIKKTADRSDYSEREAGTALRALDKQGHIYPASLEAERYSLTRKPGRDAE